MTRRTIVFDDTLYHYFRDISVREPVVLRRLREETADLSGANMQIAPEQGQFMQLLVRLTGARRIVEVGTYTGYSALWMSLALPEDGQIVCCDLSDEWTAIARRYWEDAGVAPWIRLRLAPARDTLAELLAQGEAGRFDMAFIDADKANYAAYYEQCLELLRPGGLILLDNTLWGGRVADPDNHTKDTEAIRAFNRELFEDMRVDISLVPIGDGLTLARKHDDPS